MTGSKRTRSSHLMIPDVSYTYADLCMCLQIWQELVTVALSMQPGEVSEVLGTEASEVLLS